MPDDNIPSVMAGYRLDKARIFLEDAEKCLAMGSFLTSANRSYYSIFHAMRAVLAFDRFDSKKHSGVISEFRKSYVKTGIFPSVFSDFIGDAFTIRNDSDYQDLYIISKEQVAVQFENAKVFVAAVEEYVTKKLKN